jgi:gamma-glutamylcyclotransferase (GGCT)/AIG2-like uncharacterized protein YtfP
MNIWEILLTFAVVMGIGFYIFTAPKEGERTETVFVYGTLANPLFRTYACRCLTSLEPAVLPDYEKVDLDIIPQANNQASGGIITVSEKELKRIDHYEGTPTNYRREEITIEGTTHWVYLKTKS